ncbi:hypothetical protein LAV72_04505 [Lysinibacillus xylanilyticus]|uniref:hypothetical protein n=1 Tax=Lysinibacillus xylanilyticus TaxID=582475 RepID=UPI002B253282|nr:hypothetical protein [Lysinibacillus xylanilyticus]MEB2298884.1 hypothetical protein [Lysinibacillus xylanilyticus]
MQQVAIPKQVYVPVFNNITTINLLENIGYLLKKKWPLPKKKVTNNKLNLYLVVKLQFVYATLHLGAFRHSSSDF